MAERSYLASHFMRACKYDALASRALECMSGYGLIKTYICSIREASTQIENPDGCVYAVCCRVHVAKIGYFHNVYMYMIAF
jgi:hypothetical protein